MRVGRSVSGQRVPLSVRPIDHLTDGVWCEKWKDVVWSLGTSRRGRCRSHLVHSRECRSHTLGSVRAKDMSVSSLTLLWLCVRPNRVRSGSDDSSTVIVGAIPPPLGFCGSRHPRILRCLDPHLGVVGLGLGDKKWWWDGRRSLVLPPGPRRKVDNLEPLSMLN